MKKMIRNGLLIITTAALLCSSFAGLGSIGTVKAAAVEFFPFSIIMTAGMHGNVMPFEYQGQPDFGGFAKASTKVAEIRKEIWMDKNWWENGGETMTLDIGNAIMGSQTGWLFTNKKVGDDIHPAIKAMNGIGEINLPPVGENTGKTVKGYDAMLYGAGELSIAPQRREQLRGQATFPWITANVMVGKDREKFSSDEWKMVVYKIPTAAHPLRFGVIGLTNPAVKTWEDPLNLKLGSQELYFENYLEKAREWSEILKETGEKADFITIITDLGLDKNTDGSWNKNNPIYQIIQDVTYVDFIISSSPGNPVQSEVFVTTSETGKKHETLLSQLPEDGITMGRMDLILEKCTCPVKPYVFRMENGRRVMKARFVTLDSTVPADQKIRNEFKTSEVLMKEQFDKRVGESAAEITTSNARYVDNPVAEIACKAMMKETGAEIAITDIWTTTATVKKGSFTYGDLFNVFPKDSKIYKMTLTGKQIKDALARAAQVYHTTNDKNFIIAKGFNYSLDVRPGTTNPVPVFSLDVNKKYVVATNSYIAFGQGDYKFDTKKEATSRKLFDAVEKYIKDNGGRWNNAVSKNWFVVPDYLDHWAKDYIQVLMDKKVVGGDKNGKYNPDANMVRAEAAKMVLSIYDHSTANPAKATFTDVNAKNWAYSFIEGGMTKGMWFWLKGKFEPNKNVTREEVITNMVISMGKKAEAEGLSEADLNKFVANFSDANTASPWAKKYLAYATQNGLVGGSAGKDGKLLISPTANIKRSEVAVVMAKARFPVVAVMGTADFRSEVDQWRKSFDDKALGGIAGLSYTIGNIRTSYDSSVLIDAGGMISGTAFAELGNGKLATGLYSALGYDAAALSLRDLYLGADKLKARVADISTACPVVAANIDGLDNSVKATIKTVNGIKVGIVGVVDPQGNDFVCADDLGAVKFKDTSIEKVATAINTAATQLKSKGAEIIVLAGGIPGYIELGMTEKEGFKGPAAQLAGKLSGISAMFISGSPMTFTAPASNGVQVIAPGVGGINVGLAKIRFDTKTRSIDNVSTALEPAYAKPLKIKAAVTDIHNKANSFVEGQKSAMKSEIDKVVGRTETGLNMDQNNECRLGDFITDYIREETGAEVVAFPSELGWKSIGKGNITMNDVYNALPYEDVWFKGEIKGSKLRAMAEDSVSGESSVMQISGLMFVFTRSAEVGNRVTEIASYSGTTRTPIDDDKTYTIAVPSRDLFTLPGFGREMFRTAVSNPKNICTYVRKSFLGKIMKLTEAGQNIDKELGNPVDQKGRFWE